jgi:hypothetical protein
VAATALYLDPLKVETFDELLGHVISELDALKSDLDDGYGLEMTADSHEAMSEAELGRILQLTIDTGHAADELHRLAGEIRSVTSNLYSEENSRLDDGYKGRRATWHREEAKRLTHNA